MSEWLTRSEAAAYLKVSVRQLNNLSLPRTVLGRSPRYNRAVLDEYMAEREHTPRKRGAPSRAPRRRSHKVDWQKRIDSWR